MTIYARLAALTVLSFPARHSSSARWCPSHTNADDCDVIAAIVRGQSGTPNAPINAKSFGASCDWKALLVYPNLSSPRKNIRNSAC